MKTIPSDVARHLCRRLQRADGVRDISTGGSNRSWAFLQGSSRRGLFYIHFWQDRQGQLDGVQVLAQPPGGKKHLHLGYWRAPSGLSTDVPETVGHIWDTLASQDEENQERGIYSWVPCHKLPRLEDTAPPNPLVVSDSVVTSLFGIF